MSKKFVLGIVLVAIVAATVGCGSTAKAPAAPSSAGNDVIASAFANRTSGVQVQSEGVVTSVLPDDNSGSRHQRFILQLANGQTLLMAHNIDIAPRLPALAVCDVVAFNGQYEWNSKGGTVHWTHRDPSGKHQAGWLRFKDQSYQ